MQLSLHIHSSDLTYAVGAECVLSRLLHFHLFFVNDPATTEIYTLSLHDALPIYADRLPQYFPEKMRDEWPQAIQSHPLARHIVTTMTVNEVVNGAGITYPFRLAEEMAA